MIRTPAIGIGVGIGSKIVSGGGGSFSASLDFENGVYLLNGEAVAVTDLVQEGTQGFFDLSKIVAGQGLQISTTGANQQFRNRMSLKPAVAAPILLSGTHAGMTVVATYAYTGTPVSGGSWFFGIEQGDFSGYAAEVGFWHATSSATDPSVWDYGGSSPVIAKGAGPTYKMAMSLTPSLVAASIDGNTIQSKTTTDNSAVNEIYIGIEVRTQATSGTLTTTLKKLEFFPPVDSSELPTLSGA